jgi:hypothetical protein
MEPKTAVCTNCFFPLQTGDVAYFRRKIKIIRVFHIAGLLAVPLNPDKWSATVYGNKHNTKAVRLNKNQYIT